MAKEMQLSQGSNNVYSFLEQSIANQKNNVQAMEVMYGEMKTIRDEVEGLAKEIRDENRLLPAEIDDLYEAVRTKSINIVKASTELEGDDFKKEVGKTRRFIWSKMKKKFGTSKYIHLPRKNFDEAMEFVHKFSLTDYV